MTNFPKKAFNGTLYEFSHLAPMLLQVPVSTGQISHVPVHVTFGCHCFTEGFKADVHRDHHRYTHLNELRAFDVETSVLDKKPNQITLTASRQSRTLMRGLTACRQ